MGSSNRVIVSSNGFLSSSPKSPTLNPTNQPNDQWQFPPPPACLCPFHLPLTESRIDQISLMKKKQKEKRIATHFFFFFFTHLSFFPQFIPFSKPHSLSTFSKTSFFFTLFCSLVLYETMAEPLDNHHGRTADDSGPGEVAVDNELEIVEEENGNANGNINALSQDNYTVEIVEEEHGKVNGSVNASSQNKVGVGDHSSNTTGFLLFFYLCQKGCFKRIRFQGISFLWLYMLVYIFWMSDLMSTNEEEHLKL